eukprot:9857129-Alexandrium_andersonii.AAC.1
MICSRGRFPNSTAQVAQAMRSIAPRRHRATRARGPCYGTHHYDQRMGSASRVALFAVPAPQDEHP